MSETKTKDPNTTSMNISVESTIPPALQHIVDIKYDPAATISAAKEGGDPVVTLIDNIFKGSVDKRAEMVEELKNLLLGSGTADTSKFEEELQAFKDKYANTLENIGELNEKNIELRFDTAKKNFEEFKADVKDFMKEVRSGSVGTSSGGMDEEKIRLLLKDVLGGYFKANGELKDTSFINEIIRTKANEMEARIKEINAVKLALVLNDDGSPRNLTDKSIGIAIGKNSGDIASLSDNLIDARESIQKQAERDNFTQKSVTEVTKRISDVSDEVKAINDVVSSSQDIGKVENQKKFVTNGLLINYISDVLKDIFKSADYEKAFKSKLEAVVKIDGVNELIKTKDEDLDLFVSARALKGVYDSQIKNEVVEGTDGIESTDDDDEKLVTVLYVKNNVYHSVNDIVNAIKGLNLDREKPLGLDKEGKKFITFPSNDLNSLKDFITMLKAKGVKYGPLALSKDGVVNADPTSLTDVETNVKIYGDTNYNRDDFVITNDGVYVALKNDINKDDSLLDKTKFRRKFFFSSTIVPSKSLITGLIYDMDSNDDISEVKAGNYIINGDVLYKTLVDVDVTADEDQDFKNIIKYRPVLGHSVTTTAVQENIDHSNIVMYDAYKGFKARKNDLVMSQDGCYLVITPSGIDTTNTPVKKLNFDDTSLFSLVFKNRERELLIHENRLRKLEGKEPVSKIPKPPTLISFSLHVEDDKPANVLELHTLQLVVGDVVEPGADDVGVIYNTSDKEKAIVNSDGLVTGIHEGQARISATIGLITEHVDVNILDNGSNIYSFDLVPELGQAPELFEGGALQLKITNLIEPDADTTPIVYKSSNPDWADVDGGGLVTGYNAGEVTIVATDGHTSESITLTVKPMPVAMLKSFTVDVAGGLAPQVNVGSTLQLEVGNVVDPGADTSRIHYKSTNKALATVDAQTGLVTGVNAGGLATIVATDDVYSTTIDISVMPGTGAVLNSFDVEVQGGASPTVPEGSTIQLVLTNVDQPGYDVSGATFSSADPTTATVNANSGKVTGVNAGKTVITATNGVISNNIEVTVTTPTAAVETPKSTLKSFDLTVENGAASTVEEGKTLQLEVTNIDEPGSDVSGATYSSADDTILTVDNTGLVTGVKAGSAEVTVTIGTLSENIAVTVSVALTPTVIEITTKGGVASEVAVGADLELELGIKTVGTDGADITNVKFTSSDPTVATVTEGGKVTGVKAGTVTITASDSVVSTTIDITVK